MSREYSREEILSMEVGRELDALVLDKVLRWKRSEKPWGDEQQWESEIDGQMAYRDLVIFKPSSDIKSAWEALETLDREVTVKRFEGMSGYRYWCRISSTEKFEENIAHGNTAPEAICKASLLAVME